MGTTISIKLNKRIMKIELKHWENGKTKCPVCGNNLFFEYETDGIKDSLKCTACLNDFEFNGNAFVLKKITKLIK